MSKLKRISDDELARRKAELDAEVDRREKVRADARKSEAARRNAMVRQVLKANDCAAISAFAPLHEKSRYGNDCSDGVPNGHERPWANRKEYGCLRCLLMAVAAGDLVGDVKATIQLVGAA